MRTKFLLFTFLLVCGIMNAQDTIRTLVITEARLDDARRGYVEITNVGTSALNLAQFELGVIGAWTNVNDFLTAPDSNFIMKLPNVELAPNESFLIAAVYDWGPEMFKLAPEDYDPFLSKREFLTLPDIQLHFPESPTNAASDSVSEKYRILELWNGRDCLILKHHFGDTSVMVDQVNGIFTNANTRPEPKGAIDVAGFKNATQTATLIRKFKIKEGNTNFEDSRGQDITESEWIPVPHQAGGTWADNIRRLFWTAGNHGDYKLSSLTSDVVDIDFTSSTITVPWGVRRDDSVMMKFNKVPGIAWHYDYVASYEDSASFAAKSGDTLTIYAAGNELEVQKFAIIVSAPKDVDNIVIPKRGPNAQGFYAGQTDPVYTVTDGLDPDTIGTARFAGIPYATRVDTLLKYLEKPTGASWEIVWNGGTERVDLVDGDILKVTAADGTSEKEYYIKADKYRPSHNAYLSSITWPEIPDASRGIFGWLGDTIPNFVATKYNYTVRVPADADGIPHLLAKTQNVNAKVKGEPAVNLFGSLDAKTAKFISTAEDDTTVRTYSIQLIKELPADKIQPAPLEPFISQFVWQEQWSNTFIEVVNPTSATIDMSKYMFVWGYINTPDAAITGTAEPTGASWLNRFTKYIPGYKWQDSINWKVKPAIAIPDNNVFPLVQAGDVFVIGGIGTTAQVPGADQVLKNGITHWWASLQCDVELTTGRNPWNEQIGSTITQWTGANYYMFRIDNDSVTAGLKPATDPLDFTLIDVIGSGDGSTPLFAGEAMPQLVSYIRKPGIFHGNPDFNASGGTDAATSEWTMTDRAFYDARNVPWPYDILYVTEDIGSHFMDPVNFYKSTVASLVYKISPGYSTSETIQGLATGTTVETFYGNIIKADPGQVLTVKSGSTVLGNTDVIATGDTLTVVSFDEVNTTKYGLVVVDLNSDALLTSETLTIEVTGDVGTIGGFNPGVTLKSIYESVVKPQGASLLIVDANGNYLPFKKLNFDTAYVNVQVTNQMYFDVTAENGINKVKYQLVPNSTASDAFVTSDVFVITDTVIGKIPGGLDGNPAMTTASFLANLTPAPGATLELVDKFGFQRLTGFVVLDDILWVTAEDGVTEQAYSLQMLEEDPKAFAYSRVYAINNRTFMITGATVTDTTTVADFLANLDYSKGATWTLEDKDGAAKTTGNMAVGDQLVIESSDGLITNTYGITVIVTVGVKENDSDAKPLIYPNPNRGLFTITGIEAGSRISLVNINGTLILEKMASGTSETVSMERASSGIYFVTVSNNNKVIGRYKVIKE